MMAPRHLTSWRPRIICSIVRSKLHPVPIYPAPAETSDEAQQRGPRSLHPQLVAPEQRPDGTARDRVAVGADQLLVTAARGRNPLRRHALSFCAPDGEPGGAGVVPQESDAPGIQA